MLFIKKYGIVLVLFATLAVGNMHLSNAGTDISPIQVYNQVSQTVDSTTGAIKVVNYNILEGGKYAEWKEIIKKENADILLISESGKWSPSDGSFDSAISELNSFFPDEDPYTGVTFKPDSSTDGQAVLSRYPIINSTVLERIELDNGDTWNINHPMLDAVVKIGSMEIHFIVIHFTCCDDGLSSRLKEMEGILNYIDSLGDVPIVYSGDFNSDSPEDIGDLAPPSSSLGDEPLEMLLNNSHPKGTTEHVFTDMYRTLNPYNPGFTYKDDTFQSRLDYIFVNEPLVNTMVNSTVLDFYPESAIASDHFPMNGYFNLNWETTDLRPPLPPSGIDAEVNETYTELSWNNVTETDATGYTVYRNESIIATLDIGTTNYTDDANYNENTIYKYEVTATDENGNESPKSRSLHVNSSYGILSRPSGIQLNITNLVDQLHLQWSVGDDGGLRTLGFGIYRTLDKNGVYVYQRTVAGDLSEYIDESVRAGITIFYRIRAINALGFSDFSNRAAGTAIAPDPTPTPTPTPTPSVEDTDTPLYFAASFFIPIVIINRKKQNIKSLSY